MEDNRQPDEIMNQSNVPQEPTIPVPTSAEPKNGFHERLGKDGEDFYDDDFIRTLDPEQNPYIDDQLNDENLHVEAESDYK